MNTNSQAIDDALEVLQRQTFDYFLKEANPANGLVIDKTAAGWPASIAATGLALAGYPVAVQRAFMTRAAAVARTLATLHSPRRQRYACGNRRLRGRRSGARAE